ncbi:hypothetical protein Tco_1548974 [Tanacetum coccineum]
MVSRARVTTIKRSFQPFEDLSDIGSPRADDHELLELPHMPEDPYFEAALQAPRCTISRLCPRPVRSRHAPPSPGLCSRSEHEMTNVAEDQPYDEDVLTYCISTLLYSRVGSEAEPEEDCEEEP